MQGPRRGRPLGSSGFLVAMPQNGAGWWSDFKRGTRIINNPVRSLMPVVAPLINSRVPGAGTAIQSGYNVLGSLGFGRVKRSGAVRRAGSGAGRKRKAKK